MGQWAGRCIIGAAINNFAPRRQTERQPLLSPAFFSVMATTR
jgi:hypothetical protein